MKPQTFVKFAKALGFQINVEDVRLNADEEDVEMNVMDDEEEEGNEEELAPEEEYEKKKKKAVAKNQAQAPASREVVIPDEIKQLQRLVKEVGGVNQLRTLLLSAATVTSNALEQEERERKVLIEAVKANSEDFSNDELDEMSIPTLRKFAAALQPEALYVNYGPISPALANSKGKEQVAPRPSLLLANKQVDQSEKVN